MAKHSLVIFKVFLVIFNIMPERVNPLAPTPQQPTNCLSMFDHFVGLALKGLKCSWTYYLQYNQKKKE